MKRLIIFLFPIFFILSSARADDSISSVRNKLDALEVRAYRHLQNEQWDSAVVVGQQFLEAAYQFKDYHNSIIKAHVCLGLALSHLGDYQQAMAHLGQAHTNASSIHDASAVAQTFEEMFDIARTEYAQNLRHEKNQQLLIIVIVALLIICFLLYIMYRQKNRLLMAIVRQNHEALKKPATLPDEKAQALVSRLEKLMQTEYTYRENLLTKDRVAELLETNRTYLSQVINEVYQKSFTQYINDLRINEAIRLLDNPHNNRALKLIGQDLGFNSPTTFNTQFLARTGMTPSQYRSKVQMILEQEKQNRD